MREPLRIDTIFRRVVSRIIAIAPYNDIISVEKSEGEEKDGSRTILLWWSRAARLTF